MKIKAGLHFAAYVLILGITVSWLSLFSASMPVKAASDSDTNAKWHQWFTQYHQKYEPTLFWYLWYEESDHHVAYLNLHEQYNDVETLSFSFTSQKDHAIWAVLSDESTVSIATYQDGVYTVTVPENAVRILFFVYPEELEAIRVTSPDIVLNDSPYSGAYVSILGDSISAGDRYVAVPDGDDTQALLLENQWWYLTAKELGMNILADQAVGGSGINLVAPTNEGGTGIERSSDLRHGDSSPDYVFILIGINDYLNGDTPDDIRENYRNMIQNIREHYPDAEVLLFTYPRPYTASDESVLEINAVIRQVAKDEDLSLIDLEECGITAETSSQDLRTEDTLHPSTAGHQKMAAAATEQLLLLAQEAAEAKE